MQMSSTFYGAFNIINDATGQCLDVTASSMAQGAQVIGYPCTGNANQAFQKADMGNGTVGYVAVHSGQCLHVDASGYSHWAQINQMNCSFAPNQTFTVHGDDIGNYMVAGYIDNLSADANGIHAQGWAITPQAPWSWLALRTVVDGIVITPTYQATGAWRPDVNGAYWNGYGNDRGYNYTEPYVLPAGSHNVCVQAQSYGYYDTLGCSYLSGRRRHPC